MSKTYKDINYYFAFWKHDEVKWSLSVKRFLLVRSEDMLMGQFITSTWLKYIINQEKPMHYIVFGVKNMEHRHNVLDEINRQHNGDPRQSELPVSADFCEYFEGSKEITEKINDVVKKETHTTWNFTGSNNNINQLRMNYCYYEDKLSATLPEFTIEVR